MQYLEELKKDLTASFLKEELLKRLHEVGIPEFDISVRIASEKTSIRKKHFLGFYRSMSQFFSKPYINISLINIYKKLLDDGNIYQEDSYDLVRSEVKEHMIDTVCHEYGHVVEEFLHISYRDKDHRNHSDSEKLEIINTFSNFQRDFDDNEDFAEQFGLWLAGRCNFTNEESLFNIYDFFIRKNFLPESVECVKRSRLKSI